MRRDQDDYRECDECKEFCKKGRDDFDAIKDIREGLKDIAEGLKDIEKNRICEGIKDIEEGIKDTQEGLNDICDVLKKALKF